MNVVVIGGAGFIGSHLVDRLLAEGHAVDVIDDLSTGTLGNLADARAAGGDLKIHHLDASSADADSLLGMRRPDLVYHLALFPGRIGRRWRRAEGSPRRWSCSTRRGGTRSTRSSSPSPRPPSTATRRCRRFPRRKANSRPRGVRGVVARAIVDLLVTTANTT